MSGAYNLQIKSIFHLLPDNEAFGQQFPVSNYPFFYLSCFSFFLYLLILIPGCNHNIFEFFTHNKTIVPGKGNETDELLQGFITFQCSVNYSMN